MTQTMANQITGIETADTGWKSVCRSGGIAALAVAGITIIQFIVFIVWPQPLKGSVLDWFTLFQDNWLRGLTSFELLMVVYIIFSIPIALSLFIVLRRVDKMLTAVYLVLSIMGTIFFISARPIFEMLSLSNQYAAATTDSQKKILIAAGEGMLAAFNGTSFYTSYIFGSISGLLISIVMLKSKIFSKTTAYIRIASSIFDFGLFIPVIGMFISAFSVVFLLIWDILIARRLFKLAILRNMENPC